MIPLIMSVLYVWAQLNRDMIVSFWFGTRFKVNHVVGKVSALNMLTKAMRDKMEVFFPIKDVLCFHEDIYSLRCNKDSSLHCLPYDVRTSFQ